jgi:hypothetical protein
MKMIYGLETEEKTYKKKKRGFWWKFKDMFDNKRAVQSYCNNVGPQTEKEEKIQSKQMIKAIERSKDITEAWLYGGKAIGNILKPKKKKKKKKYNK